MQKEFDPVTAKVTTRKAISQEAMSLLGTIQDGPDHTVERKDTSIYLTSGHRIGSAEELDGLLLELEDAGMVADVPDAWHPKWKITEFGWEAVTLFRNPPKISLPLLMHNTAQSAVKARKVAEEKIGQALEDAGMEVESVQVEPQTFWGEWRLVCTARFMDDEESERPKLKEIIQEALGVPNDWFKDTEVRLRGLGDGHWYLRFLGPSLEE